MSFLGADVEELQDAGQKCEQGAQTADEVIMFLKALVVALKAASFFTGGASAAYATYLETVVIPWLQKVSQALHLFAKVLGAHADAQNRASAGESVDLGSLPTYQTPGGLPAGSTSSYPPIVAPTAGSGATVPAGHSGVTTTIAPDGTTTVHVDSPAAATASPATATTPTYAAAPAGALGAATAGGAAAGHWGAAVAGGHTGSGGGSGSGGGVGGGSAGGSGAGGGSNTPSSPSHGVTTGGGVPGGSPAVDSSATYSGHYQPGDPGAASTAAMTGDGGGRSSAVPMTAGALGAAGALGLGGAALAAKGKAAGGDSAIDGLIDANGRGSKGNDVAELQKKLSAAGYDTDGVDGVWGSKTQAAVDAYRAAHPVAVTPGQGHFSPTGYDYTKITGAQKAGLSPEFYRRVEQVAANVGTKPEYLMGVMSAETNGTFSTSIKNPGSTATGLIQFTSGTARHLGTSTEALRQMSPVQQLDYVEKYLAPHRGHLGTVEGLYSTVLSGRTVENPDGVLLTRGHSGYAGNSHLDQGPTPDGRITSREAADSIRARIRR